MSEICYLCGKEIRKSEVNSDDHVVPKQLINRKQPKIKGFDYGGSLPTHEKCNNEFGPEVYCKKAIQLIRLLHDQNCFVMLQHTDNSSVKVMAINPDCLENFSEKDLTFFKFIDGRNTLAINLPEPSFFLDKPKANFQRDVLFTSLAVLTKSAAALLVKRKLSGIPQKWKVLAVPYTGDTELIDFDSIFGNAQPFDIGVKVWLGLTDTNDWFAAYKAHGILIYFLFKFSETNSFWNGIIERFQDASCWCFEGDNLNALINYQWQKAY